MPDPTTPQTAVALLLDALPVLLGVLVGGGLTAFTTWRLDARREGVQRRAELARVRRDVELEALRASLALAREFSHMLQLHDSGDEPEEVEERDTTLAAMIQHNAELEQVALRVRALASEELAQQVEALRFVVYHWSRHGATGATTEETAREAISDAEQLVDAMTETVRRDLGTAELDKR